MPLRLLNPLLPALPPAAPSPADNDYHFSAVAKKESSKRRHGQQAYRSLAGTGASGTATVDILAQCGR